MKFYFCETCGKRLTEEDIEGGDARNKKLKGVFCRGCAVGVTTMDTLPMQEEEARSVLAKQEKKPRRSSTSVMPAARRTSASSSRRVPTPMTSGGGSRASLIAGGAVGVVLMIVVAFLYSGGEGGKDPSAKSKKQTATALKKSPVTTPASQADPDQEETPEKVQVKALTETSAPSVPKADTSENRIQKAFQEYEARINDLPKEDLDGRIRAAGEFLDSYGDSTAAAAVKLKLEEWKKKSVQAAQDKLAQSTATREPEPAKPKDDADSRRDAETGSVDAKKNPESRDQKSLDSPKVATDEGVELLYYADFEKNAGGFDGILKKGVHGREGTVMRARNSNSGWRATGLVTTPLPLTIHTGKRVFVTFDYHIAETLNFNLYFRGKGDPILRTKLAGSRALKSGSWRTAVVDMGVPHEKASSRLKIWFMPLWHKKKVDLYIDNFAVTLGGMPTRIREQIERARTRNAEVTGVPEKDGYKLDPRQVRALSERDRTGVQARTVLIAGGSPASDLSFVAPLFRNELKPQDGYRLYPRGTTASRTFTGADAEHRLTQALGKTSKPEVVLIVPGLPDFKTGKRHPGAGEHYKKMIRASLDAGALPILTTYVLPKASHAGVQKAIQNANASLRTAAEEAKIPYIDADVLLNETKDAARNWRGTNLTTQGYQAFNETFLRLYRILDKRVFGRPQRK